MLLTILASVDLDEEKKDKFEKLYYTYRNTLFCVIKSILNNNADAEDVLHNTFIKIAKVLGDIEDINSRKTKSFLIVISKNTAYDFLREQKRTVYNIELEKAVDIAYLNDEIDKYVNKSEYEHICNCIRQIPSPYSEVLYFHYVCDFSIKKTARLLNRKYSTVKMQLVRGKKILLKNLSEAEYEK